jgi:hypothetical protein
MTFDWDDLKAEIQRQNLEEIGTKTGNDLLAELKKQFDNQSKDLDNKFESFYHSVERQKGIWPKGETTVDKMSRLQEEVEEDVEHLERIVETSNKIKAQFLLPVREIVRHKTWQILQEQGPFSPAALQQYRCQVWMQSTILRHQLRINPTRFLLFVASLRKRP